MNDLIYTPTKRYRAWNDPFFIEGNVAATAAGEAFTESTISYDTLDELLSSTQPPLWTEPVICREPPGCDRRPLSFWSAADYEYHYTLAHRFRCEACPDHRTFPGERWLDMHFAECHDPQIQIRRERGERTYQCYVQGCKRLFTTPKTRRLHLIDAHRYPKSFRFDLTLNGLKPRRQRRVHIPKQPKESHAQPNRHEIPMEMQIDQLTEQLAQTTVRTPQTIRFGRRNTASIARFYPNRSKSQTSPIPEQTHQPSPSPLKENRRTRRARMFAERKKQMEMQDIQIEAEQEMKDVSMSS